MCEMRVAVEAGGVCIRCALADGGLVVEQYWLALWVMWCARRQCVGLLCVRACVCVCGWLAGWLAGCLAAWLAHAWGLRYDVVICLTSSCMDGDLLHSYV
jgi:hypothetical protein